MFKVIYLNNLDYVNLELFETNVTNFTIDRVSTILEYLVNLMNNHYRIVIISYNFTDIDASLLADLTKYHCTI